MKKVLIVFVVLVLVAAGYLVWAFKFKSSSKGPKEPPPVPLAVSRHSDAFNQSAQDLLQQYYDMTEAFVNWDSVNVAAKAAGLKTALDQFRVDELQRDTIIYQSALDPLANAKQQAETIATAPTLAEKRVALNTLTDNIMQLMVTIKYDRAKMYLQECPMAFGEDKAGIWLSKTDAVRNPYMGLKHPQYKESMLECGGPKDTINFTVVDTTRR